MASTDGGTDPQQLLDKAIARADIIEILRLLDDANLDLDRRDVGHDLQTPLMRMCHMRASSDSLDAVLEKLETCAWNPNVQDATGRTLLMHACIADRVNVVLLCLENGCDVDLTDVDGNSALVYAVRNGSLEMLNWFLETEECRSLLSKINNFGQTPIDVASQDGHVSIVATLSSYMPDKAQPKGLLPKTTLTPGSTLVPPSPLTPRSPATARRLDDNRVRRSVSDSGRGLTTNASVSNSGRDNIDHSQARKGDLATLVSGKLARVSKFQNHSSINHSNGEITPQDGLNEPVELERNPALTQREMTSHSDVSEKGSPRRSKRKQRLLRRETEDYPATEQNDNPGNELQRNKPRGKKLQLLNGCRKDSVSLPDLRDLKGKLVTSGEVTPVGSENFPSVKSEKSSGKRDAFDKDDEATPTESYLERYKSGDLSPSCSLPPLQSSSADTDRRKERGPKLMHGRKNNSNDEVMLRSLIV